MNYIRQIWYEMRQQPLVTWVTIGATALSIFLVMAFYMVSQIDTVEVAPESNRSRILVNRYSHIQDGEYNSSGSMSIATARRLSEDIKGVERVSYFKTWDTYLDVTVNDGAVVPLFTKRVDDEFWNIFDFSFIEGKPFTANEVRSDVKKVILTDKAVRRLVGNRSLAGKEIMINHIPYVVAGVVKAGSPLLKESYAEMYIPWKETQSDIWNTHLGGSGVYLLMEEGADAKDIKKEVERRYKVWNSELSKDSLKAVYHGSPFTAEEVANARGSNNDPDVETPRRKRYIIYLILLLLPAINLSSMTRSRLRRRVSEIGVRRAFGASRFRIVAQLLGENFMITLMGGLIGLILSVIFITVFSSMFVDYFGFFSNINGEDLETTPAFGMLFTWSTFLFTLFFCFILNLLSTGIPAWKASSESPADAIRG